MKPMAAKSPVWYRHTLAAEAWDIREWRKHTIIAVSTASSLRLLSGVLSGRRPPPPHGRYAGRDDLVALFWEK